jgi:flagellin
MGSLNAQRSLTTVQESQQTAMERLSSGSRINRGKDDAAGLSISSGMTAINRSHGQLIRGMNDGISYVQAAEGALNESTELLQRMRELTLQSLSNTYSDEQRSYMNQEFTQLKTEIDNIANKTSVNDHYPLMPATTTTTATVTGSTAATAIVTTGTPDILAKLNNVTGSAVAFPSGIKPLAYIPAGSTGIQLNLDNLGADDDIHIFTRDGKHLAGPSIHTAFGDVNNTFSKVGVTDKASLENRIFTATTDFDIDANYDSSHLNNGGGSYNNPPTNNTSYNGMTIAYSGDDENIYNKTNLGPPVTTDTTYNDGSADAAYGNKIEKIEIDTVNEDLIVVATGSGSFKITFNYSTYGTPNYSSTTTTTTTPAATATITTTTYKPTVTIPVNSYNLDDKVGIEYTPADSISLGIDDAYIDTIANASTVLSALDKAINTVSAYKSTYGAIQNRFEHGVARVNSEVGNLSSAISRIQDTDYAIESAELARTNVLQQAGMSMLSQANQAPNHIISLLKH